MKKLLFILTAGAICSFSSCSNEKEDGEMSETAKKNLDAMHGVTKCFETKDFSKLGDFIAEDGVDHAGEKGDVKGLANIKAELEKMVAGVDGMKSEIIREFADDEYVISWMRTTGTLKTDQMGMKAGDKIDSKAIEVAKFKDGKATEHWSYMEPAEMMKMMGGMPPAPTDTTKKEKPIM